MGHGRVVKILNKALDTFILLVCVLILLISIYSLIDNFRQFNDSTDISVMDYKPSEDEPITEERLITENQVAWVTIYDSAIDYPVMQGEDNSEYLNKDPYGEFQLSGSIFLDYRNDKNLNDEYSVIYGHHLEYGVMFGSLDDFMDQTYFDAHRQGRIVTESAVYDFELFAVATADAGNGIFFSPYGRTTKEVTEYLKDHSMIYNPHDEDGRIVALSTCTEDGDLTRLLVFGTIREQGQEVK